MKRIASVSLALALTAALLVGLLSITGLNASAITFSISSSIPVLQHVLQNPVINDRSVVNMPESGSITVSFSPPENEMITSVEIYRAVSDPGSTENLTFAKLPVTISEPSSALRMFTDKDLTEGKCYTYRIVFSSGAYHSTSDTQAIYYPVKPKLSFAADPGYQNGVVALKWSVDDNYKKFVDTARIELYNNKGVNPTKGSYIYTARMTGGDIPCLKFTTPGYVNGSGTEPFAPGQIYDYYTHLSYTDSANRTTYDLDSNIVNTAVPAAAASSSKAAQSSSAASSSKAVSSSGVSSSSASSSDTSLAASSKPASSDISGASSKVYAQNDKSRNGPGGVPVITIVLICAVALILIAAAVLIIVNRQKIIELIKKK